MKIVSLLTLTLLSSTAAWADPFDARQIAEDTKWLVHLDVVRFKESALGSYLLDMAKTELNARKSQFPVSVNVDAVLQELQSVTAYGTTFEDHPENHSVLIVKTGEKGRAIIDGFLASQEASADGNAEAPVKALSGKRFPSYLVANEVNLTFPTKDLIVVSKDYSQIEKALSVIQGRAPKLAKTSSLQAPPDEGYFFVASADGLNALKNIPPQARILQKATGARISFGEGRGLLITQIALTTSGPEVSTLLKRVVDGSLAMLSLVQFEDPSLTRFTQSITVSEAPTAVSIGASYPIDEIKKLIASLRAGNSNLISPGPRREPRPAEVVVSDAIGGERLKIANVDARSDNGHLARNAVDADPVSYWSATGRGQWIRFELDQPSLVRELQIAWAQGNQRKNTFTVQTSRTGTTWTSLVTRTSTGNTDGLESVNIPDTATQWIRILSLDGQVGIADLRLFGQAGVSLPAEPTAPLAATAPEAPRAPVPSR